jgi:hypothetical protein
MAANLSNDFTSAELAELFAFLDNVRASGVTNMLAAGPCLVAAYGMDEGLARKVLAAWLETFSGNGAAQRASEVLR